jgi:ABC-type transporter Mla MlaB component
LLALSIQNVELSRGGEKMLCMTEQERVALVYLSGDLNRGNILPIRDDIMGRIQPGAKAIEFHFENVYLMDTPAMAMLVIIIRQLYSMGITSKVKGINRECMSLGMVLGLDLVAEVEGKVSVLEHRGRTVYEGVKMSMRKEVKR